MFYDISSISYFIIYKKMNGLDNVLVNIKSQKTIILSNKIRETIYRIQPNYRPYPHNLFTYYRPLDDLFPDFLVYFHLLSPTWRSFDTSGREQIYVAPRRAPIRSNTLDVFIHWS